MKDYLPILIGAAFVSVAFAILWKTGGLARLSLYIQETREELRKCTWPSWDELKGSTAVVMLSIAMMGAFTVAVDYVLLLLVSWMVKI